MTWDEMRSLTDLCSRSGAVCGEGLLAEVVRLTRDNERLTQWLRTEQDEVTTLRAAVTRVNETLDFFADPDGHMGAIGSGRQTVVNNVRRALSGAV